MNTTCASSFGLRYTEKYRNVRAVLGGVQRIFMRLLSHATNNVVANVILQHNPILVGLASRASGTFSLIKSIDIKQIIR